MCARTCAHVRPPLTLPTFRCRGRGSRLWIIHQSHVRIVFAACAYVCVCLFVLEPLPDKSTPHPRCRAIRVMRTPQPPPLLPPMMNRKQILHTRTNAPTATRTHVGIAKYANASGFCVRHCCIRIDDAKGLFKHITNVSGSSHARSPVDVCVHECQYARR